MKSKAWRFECAEHEEFGSKGWKLVGNQNADPLSGMAVAHDILEHPLKSDMGVEDELMALGASLYVRQYSKNMHSLGVNIASDIPAVLSHVWYEGMVLRDPGRTTRIEAEYEIDDCLASLQMEAEYQDALKEKLTASLKSSIRGWMRRGYREAVKRWRGVSTRDLFDDIEREADKCLKHADEGQILTVRLDFSRSLITDSRHVVATVEIEEMEYPNW